MIECLDMSPQTTSQVRIRRATPEDAASCGRICYEAFFRINQEHNFPCDFESPEMAHAVISGIFAQALIVRRALRNIDPWKSISEVQSANRGIAEAEVERAVAKAVKAPRKNRRG